MDPNRVGLLKASPCSQSVNVKRAAWIAGCPGAFFWGRTGLMRVGLGL